MNKLQNITEKVRAINDPCENCEGTGRQPWVHPTYRTSATKDRCKTCFGKGYVQELEKGCEVEYTRFGKTFKTVIDNYWVLRKKENLLIEYTEEEFPKALKYKITKNYGKPLDGMEILLALSKESCFISVNMDGRGYVSFADCKNGFHIPLNKKPPEYDEVLLDQLDEIL
jgi:hypothetical protein